MNTNKKTLIESINKQRRLMGLNEIMDVNTNIDAKGALSGNKLDLGVVPLEEMEPEDDDLSAIDRMYNSDDWVRAQRDAMGLDDEDDEDDEPISFDDERGDDEMDFYRGEDPMSLDDRMDMKYPDPNERDFELNRYSRKDDMMNENVVNEEKVNEIIGQIKNFFKTTGQTWKYSGALNKYEKIVKNVDKQLQAITNMIEQVNAQLPNLEQNFKIVQQYGEGLPVNKEINMQFGQIKSIATNTRNMLANYNKARAGFEANIDSVINQLQPGGQTNQPAAGGQTNQPAAGGQTNQPAAGGQTNQPAAGGQRKKAKKVNPTTKKPVPNQKIKTP